MGLQQFDEFRSYNDGQTFTNATGTAKTAIATLFDGVRRIDAIYVVSTAAAAHVVKLTRETAATELGLGSVTIPANAGSNGAKAVELIGLLGLGQDTSRVFPNGENLFATLAVALGAGETLSFLICGGYLSAGF